MPDDAMTDAELRQWAEKVKDHSAAARGVLRLLAEVEALMQAAIPDLTKPPSVFSSNNADQFFRDGKLVFDGSTGTPLHGQAGHKSESAQ